MSVTYDSIKDLFAKLSSSHSQRNGEYDLSRQRYSGVMWDSTNPRPENRYSLDINYLKPFVDKSIQLLVGRLPALQVMPSGTDMDARKHAEKLEGLLYGVWENSDASDVLFKVAFDSFVLRRGIVYYWWDPADLTVRFKQCIPDDFYPEYDGDRVYRCLYVHRRLTDSLRKEHPGNDSLITDEPPAWLTQVFGQDQPRLQWEGYTTVIDYYDVDGTWARVAGDFFTTANLGHPLKEVPFIEFPCYPVGGNREPMNLLDQLVELNQYLCQVVSQKADIISKFANPVILDFASGQAAEDIRRAVAASGSVIPVKKDGNIGFLNWEGTTPAIDEQITLILDMMFDISGKPRSSFGQTVTNQSGVVTNLTLTPTLQSNEYHETIWGRQLSRLNERILQLTEKFGAGQEFTFKGRVPSGKALQSSRLLNVTITGEEIGGWYKNRLKWPSAIRVDDPVYVQNDLAQLTSDPPALSLYTSLENRGIEDVEAEIDRILEQQEDPRLNPEGMAAGMDALGAAQTIGDPDAAAMAGTMPGDGGEAFSGALEASGSPYTEALS